MTANSAEVIEGSSRRALLYEAGVPLAFLAFLDRAGQDPRLSSLFAEPSAFAAHIRCGGHWTDLCNSQIAILFENANGDVAHLLRVKDGHRAFLEFGLDEQTLEDYGLDVARLLADQIIELWEFLDSASPTHIGELGQSMGFLRAEELVAALEQAERKGARSTFEADRIWRGANLSQLCVNALEPRS